MTDYILRISLDTHDAEYFLGETGGGGGVFGFFFGQYLNVYCHYMLYSSSDCPSMCSIAYVMIINVYRGYTKSFNILPLRTFNALCRNSADIIDIYR